MRVFVAVANANGFAAAARQLRRSPSVVTRAIAQLERALGRALFVRTTRAVRLTEPGREYLARATRILDDVRDAARAVRGEGAALAGALTVAAPIAFGRLHVLPIVARLLRAHPGLAVDLSLSDRNARLVEEGVDVAVRIGALADSSAIAVRLSSTGRILVASPGYLDAHGSPRRVADIAKHAAIAFLDATDEWQFRTASVRVAPRLIVNTADAAVAAAEDGLGLARVLAYQARAAIEAGRLVEVLASQAPEPLPIHALYTERRATGAVAAFVAEARAYFAQGETRCRS